MEETKIALFKGKAVRKTFYQKEWWFAINDVIESLTDSSDPAQYFKRLRERDYELSKLIDQGGVQFVPPLMLTIKTTGGKQKMYCWNTEGIFRLVQSIPSPKAEPFKRWLAKVGYERVQEIENPELGTKRTRMLYKLKGYPDSWIEKRMRGIEVRETLTDEWQKHEVKMQKEYEILTAEIAHATFGLTPSQHKKVKGLKRENLRDHMNDLELIFSMLGEAATTEIVRTENPLGFVPNKKVAKRGGGVAGLARRKMEIETGKKVVSKDNFLPLIKNKKQIV